MKKNYKRQIKIDTLALEITRRCNMACRHCLRGPAEDLDMPETLLPKIFKDITDINDLVLTGGEPSLNVPMIRKILNYIKDHDIYVDNFYVVTNGKQVSDEFIQVMLDYYLAFDNCDEISAVALSQDEFHEKIPKENIKKLKALSFFNETGKNIKDTDLVLLLEGRARELNYPRTRSGIDYTHNLIYQKDPKEFMIDQYEIDISKEGDCETINWYDIEVYISADGTVKINCDNSYANLVNAIGNLYKRDLYTIIKDLHTETLNPENQHQELYRELLKVKQELFDAPVSNTCNFNYAGANIRITLLPNKQVRYAIYNKNCIIPIEIRIGDTGHCNIFETTHVLWMMLIDNGFIKNNSDNKEE